MIQDLRYALRQLRRSPGFAVTVIGVLALGIGANSAIFTVLNGTLLRRLPYRSPGELVALSAKNSRGEPVWKFLPDIVQWQQRSRTLDGIAYYNMGRGYLAGDAAEIGVSSVSVSPNLFGLLGVSPAIGRGFLNGEQQKGKSDVVVLSDAVWRSQFHGASVLGKVVKFDDVPVTVVGVMPRGFIFPADEKKAQVWRPVQLTDKSMGRSFESPTFNVIGRVHHGVTAATVQQELTEIQKQLRPFYVTMSADLAPSQVEATNYRESLVQDQKKALLGLLAAVAIVWLIACANVANLMLARSSARRREMAIRGALGASAWRIVRQLMVESLVLSLMGAGLGLAMGQMTLSVFHQILTSQVAPMLETRPDGRVLFALLGLSVLSALLFGVVPALVAGRRPLDQALRQDGTQAGLGRSQHRLQRVLVVTEIGLSLSMLVACGLLLKTVFALRHVPLGFRTDHVYVVTPTLPGYKYRALDANQTVYKPLLERVKRMHGVEAAALTTVVPLDKGFSMEMQLYLGGDGPHDQFKQRITATMKATGPELQQVLGFKMAQGRYFNAQDTPDSQPVAVVNRAFAKLYEQGGSSIKKFSMGATKDRQFKIVGVIDDFHQVGIAEPALPEIDYNAAQLKPDDNMYGSTLDGHIELAIRASGNERNLLPDLQRVMREVNPDLSASTIRTMDQVVEDALGSQLLAAHLLETLGILALLVALAGLYSLLAYLVALRTRELGLRMALGAKREQILELVMKQAGWLIGGGVVVGVGVSLAATQLLEHFLFGVSARDVGTIAAAAILMMVVGGMAAYLPARRASRIEPMDALRTE
jgi:predicted permease